MARGVIKTFLPSAAQIGFAGMRRMVKRQQIEKAKLGSTMKRQSGIGVPLAPVSPPTVTQPSLTPAAVPVPLPAAVLPPSLSAGQLSGLPAQIPAPLPAGYNYPGYHQASFYPYPYGAYQYPYYGYPYPAVKRMFLPYAYGNTYSQSQQPPYQFQYPAAFAQAYSASSHGGIEEPVPTNTAPQDSPGTSTASGISQGLIDLENDVNGFNEAIQYMKEAFISENDSGSDLHEDVHGSINGNNNGVKKDFIKKKKTSQELMAAFKRTIESKQKLENKLVNYFTNYVCGDDC